MADVLYHDAGINTVSFTDAPNALSVLMQNGNVRKGNRPRPGDIAFTADGYVAIVQDIVDKHHTNIRGGWRPANQGKRAVTLRRAHNTIDILAYADPVLPVKEAYAKRVLEPSDRKQIAELLAVHPAVDTYVASHDFNRAYARWQRYCGYGPDKADGRPDQRSLDRLGRETRA